MIKRKAIGFIALASTLVLGAGVGVSVLTNHYDEIKAVAVPNLVINAEDIKEGDFTVESANGGRVTFNCTDGVIKNVTPIQNIKRAKISKGKDQGTITSFNVDYGFKNKEGNKQIVRKNQVTGGDYSFNNEKPSFFEVKPYEGTTVNTIELYYDCVNGNDNNHAPIPSHYTRVTQLIGTNNNWGNDANMEPYTFTLSGDPKKTYEDEIKGVHLVRGNYIDVKSTYADGTYKRTDGMWGFGDSSCFAKDGNIVRVLKTGDYDFYFKHDDHDGNRTYITSPTYPYYPNMANVKIKLVNNGTDAEINPILAGSYHEYGGHNYANNGNGDYSTTWDKDGQKFIKNIDGSFEILVESVNDLQFRIVDQTYNKNLALGAEHKLDEDHNYHVKSEGVLTLMTIEFDFSKFGKERLLVDAKFEHIK